MHTEFFDISGPALFIPKAYSDSRGTFSETFKENVFREATGSELPFVQSNQSLSLNKGTIRGLHFQTPPHAQGKLVRCVAGSILDVAVDARQGSSTYGQHISAILNAENRSQLWVPPGFLHGFSTLEDQTIVLYKCTDYYSPECDGNVQFDDPDLKIDWGLGGTKPILSDKDLKAPTFESFESPFKV